MKIRKLFILLVLTMGLFNVSMMESVTANSMLDCDQTCDHN